MTSTHIAVVDTPTESSLPKRRPGRPSSGLDTVQVCVRLRRDQVEQIRAIVDEGLYNPNARSISSILRVAVDNFFAQ